MTPIPHPPDNSRRLASAPGKGSILRRGVALGTYGLSAALSRIDSERYDDVEVFCAFLGYTRSGSSFIGSMLDAHPNMAIPMEADALRMVEMGADRRTLFKGLIMRSTFVATFLGNRWTGYDYAVPGGHQGRWERLLVIGDKQARRTLARIHHKPELLDRLRDTVQCELRILHVIRNPFDSIATMHNRNRSVMKARRRAGTTDLVLPHVLDRKIAAYFDQSRRMEDVRTTRNLEILDIYQEGYLEEPIGSLATIVDFLGLSASDDYLQRCASVALSEPRRSRFSIEWPPGSIASVRSRIRAFETLCRYDFDT